MPKAFSSSQRACGCRMSRAVTRRRFLVTTKAASTWTVQEAEGAVLDVIKNVTGRGKSGLSASQQERLDAAVAFLEADAGVAAPTANQLLNGRWRLLYTSRPGSASPIQRTFTGVEAFKIFQEVLLDEGESCRVNNVVEFGENAKYGVLKVEAEASTDSRPMPGFTPRQGPGIALFGKSQFGPPAKKDIRIDFQFDQAAFAFRFLPFKVPYPVPFKYLGDETKGWIDITYLNRSGTFRLTRGNKGTLFILSKQASEDGGDVAELLAAARDGVDARVLKYVARLEGRSPASAPARSALINAKWKLIWSQQAEDANPLQKALVGQVNNWQILQTGDGGAGTLENRVDLGLVRIRALAACEATSDAKSSVVIDKVLAVVGGREFELPNVRRDSAGFVEWLYVDQNVRVTRGNRGSLFVHVRDDDA